MDAAKPYEFLGLGAVDAAKPCEVMGLGAVDAAKPSKKYKVWGSGCRQIP